MLGTEAYRRDLPSAERHMLDASHFALETHVSRIVGLIREFLEAKVVGGAVLCNA